MSKRRNRERQPNIPSETLQRAREQAGLVAAPPAAEPDAKAPAVAPLPDTGAVSFAPTASAVSFAPTASAGSVRRRKVAEGGFDRPNARGEPDQERVKFLLENPTKIVTEAQLRQDYFHVLIDLRNMGLLAAVLITVLVALSFVL